MPASTATPFTYGIMHKRTHVQKLELAEDQMVLELRPRTISHRSLRLRRRGHQPEDLSASIWMWHREGNGKGEWKIKR